MFIVKKNSEMMNKTFRLPVDLLERLTEVAKAQEVSVNNLVQQCCEYALGDMAGGGKAETKQRK
ncbi:CopG-like RHH_1 or ribbon-helix-helix domain-containing protein, RHH_5 [Selenomonas sp. GACV-9]|uniref:ribbon-helix-helix domain-containing protein n=1 Tax=Selenomonas sp. GACV-9 TaxID=3158782 RepID=UPI0008E08B1C|nr:CopG-like RHH_1 or ribbon-helix-helix domain-containing protein, RHH_5 [Selenomonas ruminantium]